MISILKNLNGKSGIPAISIKKGFGNPIRVALPKSLNGLKNCLDITVLEEETILIFETDECLFWGEDLVISADDYLFYVSRDGEHIVSQYLPFNHIKSGFKWYTLYDIIDDHL